jgi:hypothetical protein
MGIYDIGDTSITSTSTAFEQATVQKTTDTDSAMTWALLGMASIQREGANRPQAQITEKIGAASENVVAGNADGTGYNYATAGTDFVPIHVMGEVASVGDGVTLKVDLDGAEAVSVTPNPIIRDGIIVAFTWELESASDLIPASFSQTIARF